MACTRQGGAFLCSRGRARRRPESRKAVKPEIPKCRRPGCDRDATQAGYACTPHWWKLTTDLRARLYAAAVAPGADRRAGDAVADEPDRHFAEQLARERKPAWRQPELPL